MDDVRDTVTINSILTTSDQAYSKTDLNSDTLEKEDGDEAEMCIRDRLITVKQWSSVQELI